MNRRIAIIAVFASIVAVYAAFLVAPSHGQTMPDRRGEVAVDTYTYQGKRAQVPFPASMWIRNEGGSDGLGICVVTTGAMLGQYLKIPGLERGRASDFWQTAKHRPGGHGPDKLDALVKETLPGVGWKSFVGTNPQILDTLLSRGIPVASTMSYGQDYPGRIHHDVGVIEFKTGGRACFVDSNFPGKYHFLPAEEFARRSIDGGSAWYWWWDVPPQSTATRRMLLIIVIVGLGGTAVVAVAAAAVVIMQRQTGSATPTPDNPNSIPFAPAFAA